MSKNWQNIDKNVLELAKYRKMPEKQENTDQKVQKSKRNSQKKTLKISKNYSKRPKIEKYQPKRQKP